MDDTQDSVDDPLQDDNKNAEIKKNNSGEGQTTLNDSIITYETNLEEKKCDHTRKETCTCVNKNYIFEHNHLNMCTQTVGKDKNGNKSYSSKSNFTKQTDDKLFSCSVCSKSFANKRSLTRHAICHVAEKPFICNICNKSFSWRHALKQHIRVHTGEKPFVCNICNKSFGHISTLHLHVRIHRGEKPFVCDICSRSFSTRYDLGRHSRTNTGEKPFTCKPCCTS